MSCTQKKLCSRRTSFRAIDEARTRDLHLGKVAYYQLYYYRIYETVWQPALPRAIDEARTRDLHLGKVAYYQLYYYRIYNYRIYNRFSRWT